MEMLLFLREYYGHQRGKQTGFETKTGFFMLLRSMKIKGKI